MTMITDQTVDLDALKLLRDTYACPCDESKMYDRFLLPRRASGMWVWVENDEEPYLDLVLGYSSLNFGHCHPEILRSVHEAAENVSQIHSFHTAQKLKLSEYLVNAIDPHGGYQVYFDVGGTSVVGSAMRLCRSYTNRKTVISFERAFHGAGDEPSTVTDHRLLNEEQYGLGDKSAHVKKLPFPSKHGNVSVDRCLQMLDELIARDKPAAVIVEPIQGAAGFIIPHDDFLPRLRDITEAEQIMLIADEIQMGMGRTGALYSFQHWGIKPDIVLLSKSLAGGYFPLSAIIARTELFENVSPSATAFQSTFNNNPFGIQVALDIAEMVDREDLYDNARIQGGKLLKQLQFIEDSPFTANLRGHGAAIAFDVVDSKSSGRPARELAGQFVNIALDEHVIVYACGVHGSCIKFAPMITMDDDDISTIVSMLRACFARFNELEPLTHTTTAAGSRQNLASQAAPKTGNGDGRSRRSRSHFSSMKKTCDFNARPIVLDVTIRDGGYLNNWYFPVETIRKTVRYLDRLGVDVIEVGYLSDDETKPPAYQLSAGFMEMLAAETHGALLAGMMNPTKYKDPLAVLASRKGFIDLVRLPTLVEDVESVIQFVTEANKLGIRCSMNLVSFTAYTESELLGAVKKIASSGQVGMIYFADSRGAVCPESVYSLYSQVRKIWEGPLGFHAHDNLGFAIENSRAALEAGANLIDCSIEGYGLGGRNTEFVKTMDLVRDVRPELPDVDKRELDGMIETIDMPPQEVFHDLYYHTGLKNLEQEWAPILWEMYGNRCFEILDKLPRRRYKSEDEVIEFAEQEGFGK